MFTHVRVNESKVESYVGELRGSSLKSSSRLSDPPPPRHPVWNVPIGGQNNIKCKGNSKNTQSTLFRNMLSAAIDTKPKHPVGSHAVRDAQQNVIVIEEYLSGARQRVPLMRVKPSCGWVPVCGYV